MTDQELREIVARLSLSLEESDKRLSLSLEESDKKLSRSLEESGRKLSFSLEESKRETDKALRQLSKQMGELGNKFGSFAEGMALPSMEKVFYRDFGLNIVNPRAKARLNGRTLEIDVLAFDSRGERNEVYIVEVKSHLTEEGIEQILKTIEDFPKFFSHLSDRKIYGIIAAVDIPENLRKEVLRKGLYLARISDDTFKLQVPPGFKPKAFGRNGEAEANGQKKKGATPARKRGKKSKKGAR
jgi:hypothetical protein